jgi:hypothetical protein
MHTTIQPELGLQSTTVWTEAAGWPHFNPVTYFDNLGRVSDSYGCETSTHDIREFFCGQKCTKSEPDLLQVSATICPLWTVCGFFNNMLDIFKTSKRLI